MARRSRLIARRKMLGCGQEELAHRLGLDVSTVRRWERGTSNPAPWHRRPLAEALDVDLGTLDELLAAPAAPTAGPDQDGDDLNRREFTTGAVLAAIGLPDAIRRLLSGGDRPLTHDDVRALAAAVDDLRARDSAVGGGALCDVAVAMHDRVTTWLRHGSHAREITATLKVLAGDLGAQVGWLAYDAGRLQLAHRYLQDTIIHARLTDYRALEVRSMASMCLVLNRLGDPRQSLQSADAALRIVGPEAPPRVGALLHQRAAGAHARLGDSGGFARSVAAAELAFDRARDDDPAWTRFVSPGELTGLAGQSQMILGRPDQAAAAFRTVTETPDPAHHRNAVYYTVQLAHALSRQGDGAQAAAVGLGVLPEVVALHSGRTRRDLHQLRAGLSDASSPAAQDFVDAYDEAVRT